MAGPANPDDVQKAYPFPKGIDLTPQTDREKQVGRALTTVNRDDFSPKPAPKTAETD